MLVKSVTLMKLSAELATSLLELESRSSTFFTIISVKSYKTQES
jgi:hypothetical protein